MKSPLFRSIAAIASIVYIASTVSLLNAQQEKSNLKDVTFASIGNSAVTIRCIFSPYTPIYQISSLGPATSFDILFRGAAERGQANLPAIPSALIKNLSLTSMGSDLLLKVKLADPGIIRVHRDTQAINFDFVVSPKGTIRAGLTATAPTTGTVGSFRVIQLKYADVSEVAGILGPEGANIAPSDSFAPTSAFSSPQNTGIQTLGQGASGLSLQSPASISLGSQDQGHAAYGQRVAPSIAVDRRLNAVILFGTPQEVEQQAAIIEALDIPSKNVTFEAEIVELTDAAARNVGILVSNGTSAVSGSLTTQALSPPQASISLQAQILAQVEEGQGKLLAHPRIQTTSGTAASILTGDELPILTSLTIPGNPPLVQQQLQYVNVGVHLQILPRVSLDGNVTSHIIAEVSSVTGSIEGNIPQVSQRQAIATATVHDGQAYVIGGLIQDDELKTTTKIPFIGDIPLVGPLFRATQSTLQRTNLYIVVTPHVSSE